MGTPLFLTNGSSERWAWRRASLQGQGTYVAGIYPVRRDELLRVVNFDCLMINSRHPAVANAKDVRGRG